LYGVASIDTAVALPEPESRPDLSDITKILQQSLKANQNLEGNFDSNVISLGKFYSKFFEFELFDSNR